MAKARPIPELGKDDPFALAAARIVAVRTRELVASADDVLDIRDIERVHDMRVATRRLRAALEVFESCFPRKRFRAALKEVKTLADALGERRDRDVHIAALTEFEAAVGPADQPGIRSLIGRLRDEQTEANEALGPHVTQERIAVLRERLEDLVAEAQALAGDADPPPEPGPGLPERAPAVTNGGKPH